MSNPIFDNVEFARNRKTLAGELPLSQLERVADDVLGGGPIEFGLAGGNDQYERYTLDLRLVGCLQLECQRCLKPMDFELDVTTRFTLFSNETKLEEAESADEDLEGLLMEREFHLLPLIEDEILLSLPYTSVHDACAAEENAVAPFLDNVPGVKKPNPFAVLAELKGKLKPGKD